MRPIVHIGFHKTATTWFQKQIYPRAESHRWIPRPLARKVLLEPDGLGFDASVARRMLYDPQDPRPVAMCEENFSGYIHNGGLHGLLAPEMARRIKATLPDALIVIMIRSQPEVIAASYVQYVRGGGTYGPRRYLFASRYCLGAFRHPYKAPRFAFGHFEYDRLVAYYDSLFGPENVLVLPYEALRYDPQGFLAQFLARTGLRLDAETVDRAPSNRSFGALTVWAGRGLGLFTARSVVDKYYILGIPGFYELRRVILKLLCRIDRRGAGPAILGGRILVHIRSHYAASNRRLARLRPLDLENMGYPMQPEKSVAKTSMVPFRLYPWLTAPLRYLRSGSRIGEE
jgi:hypothetical protein